MMMRRKMRVRILRKMIVNKFVLLNERVSWIDLEGAEGLGTERIDNESEC